MWEFVKVVKGLAALWVLAWVLVNVAYVMWMISWFIASFYGYFCYMWVSWVAIGNVVALTSSLVYAFLVVFLYRLFFT